MSARGSTSRHDSHVVVADRSGHVGPASHDAGTTEAHRRFGGVDVPATLAGLVATLGTLVVLSGLAAGIGTIGYQSGIEDRDDLSIGGFVAGLVVLFLAFLAGGWVAGRVARYDGGRNGLLSGIWFVVLAAGVAALGAWAGDRYDIFDDLEVPRWFEDNARTPAAIVTGVVALIVALLAGYLGGRRGERYHHRADEVLVATRPVVPVATPDPAPVSATTVDEPTEAPHRNDESAEHRPDG